MARRHRLKLPSEVVTGLDLHPGERPLAWASGRAERWLVGTATALHLDAPEGRRRLGWEEIERAEWSHDSDTLAVVEVTGWGLPERRTEFALVDPGQLLELLRERVTKSVVLTVFAPVHGRRGINVVGRRSPTGTGEIQWSYVLAEGLDPDDPYVAEVAERTLAEAQAELAFL